MRKGSSIGRLLQSRAERSPSAIWKKAVTIASNRSSHSSTDGERRTARISRTNQNPRRFSDNFAKKIHDAEVKHANVTVNVASFLLPMLLSWPWWAVLIAGFCFYVSLAVAFALLLWTCGRGCYDVEPTEEFEFHQMFWLSFHVFSTIGFPPVQPACTAAQFILLFETYVSIIVLSSFGGYVIFVVLQPRPRVRFSSQIMVGPGPNGIQPEAPIKEEPGPEDNIEVLDTGAGAEPGISDSPQTIQFLTCRMVRTSYMQLKDVRLQLQARYWDRASLGWHSADQQKVGTLSLTHPYHFELEFIQLWHVIDQDSPLWEVRDSLNLSISNIEVLLTAFDMTTMQEIKCCKTYTADDLVFDAKFDVMVEFQNDDGRRLKVDHGKIDSYSFVGLHKLSSNVVPAPTIKLNTIISSVCNTVQGSIRRRTSSMENGGICAVDTGEYRRRSQEIERRRSMEADRRRCSQDVERLLSVRSVGSVRGEDDAGPAAVRRSSMELGCQRNSVTSGRCSCRKSITGDYIGRDPMLSRDPMARALAQPPPITASVRGVGRLGMAVDAGYAGGYVM